MLVQAKFYLSFTAKAIRLENNTKQDVLIVDAIEGAI
jgi:hypothetical protein